MIEQLLNNDDLKSNCFNFVDDITNKLYCDLNKQLDIYFIEGLKIKGFEFTNKTELELFIKQNCRCEDHINVKERVYFINDTPFLLYNYELNTKIELKHNPITASATFGSFSYL